MHLLERLGHEVVFPQAQTCCGQMHVNTGYQREALPLVRHHVEVFEPYDGDRRAVRLVRRLRSVTSTRWSPAGPGDDGARRSAAEAVAARTYELSEFLVDVLGVDDVGAYFPHRVTYHPTCHSLRMLRVGDKPLRLLRDGPRASTLVELPDADQCCGFGGTFAVKNADTSTAMLADKMRHVRRHRRRGRAPPATLRASCTSAAGCPGCAPGARTVHLAEILAATDRSEVHA